MEYQSENYVAACDFLKLLRNGYDTKQMAHLLGVSEPFVYNMMDRQREAERIKAPKPRRCPNEDWNTSEPYYPKLIPYAGKDD